MSKGHHRVQPAVAWPGLAACGGPGRAGGEQTRSVLAAFRGELDRCLGRYGVPLPEVCDAVPGQQHWVYMAAELSLEPECRYGHGAVDKALNQGRVQVARLRWALAAVA
jgi:hypothetical protein